MITIADIYAEKWEEEIKDLSDYARYSMESVKDNPRLLRKRAKEVFEMLETQQSSLDRDYQEALKQINYVKPFNPFSFLFNIFK